MKALIFPLLILFFIAVFSQCVSLSALSAGLTSGSNPQSWSGSGSITIDGNSTTLSGGGLVFPMGFDITSGAIALVVACIAIAAVGIKVFDSGLSEFSVKIIYVSLAFFGFWGLLSAFSLSAFTSIPFLGWAMYFVLTAVYAVGVFERISG